MLNAQSEAAFYLIELSKVLFPVAAISIILAALLLFGRAAAPRRARWLAALTALWLLITLLSRAFLSEPVMHHYLSGTRASGEDAQAGVDFYSTVTSLLWAGEHVMLLAFAIGLFVFLRPRSKAQ